MEEITYQHTLPIQQRFNDVDKFGHVNNTVYFSFYDLGKTDYFATACPVMNWERDGVVMAHLEANFLTQIFGHEPIAVQTATVETGTKSLKLQQRVINTKTGEVKCICVSTLVAFDLVNHESKALDESWVEAICAYEKRDVRKSKTAKQ